MPVQRWILVVVIPAVAGVVALAQPGRGGSQWPTARADAQRTSWIRADEKISVDSVGKPGFELQWKVKLDNQPRGPYGLAPGVTAAGVTLFVPISIVAGSSNTVHAIDNDTGYVVWRRQFDLPLPAATPACAGGMTAGATRIVRLDESATAATPGLSFGRGFVGYRSLVGEPGEGVPVEGRAGGRGRSTGDPTAPPPAAPGRGSAAGARGGAAAGRGTAAARPPVPGRSGAQPAERIPGTPRREEAASPYAFLFRESGVVYVTASDGVLHVLGLPSGKDMQRPAPFVPADAQPSALVAVGTMLYTSTSGQCGGAPSAVWALDLDSETKPVVSWKTNGGPVVGSLAFTADGTLLAAIGSGQTTADGKANAIVALDARTLKLKDWFTQPNAEFVTGPTILRHGGREVVAAATKDGRLIVLDAASLGGADHATPLASRVILGPGGRVSADALAAWRGGAAGDTSWILVPVSGRLPADVRPTNGAAQSGSVVALELEDRGGAPSLQHGWVSHELSAPATPLVVNGVVFTLATGAGVSGTSGGAAAVLHAYDGATGKRLWHSGKAMTAPASPGSLWSGLGQIYVGARDGTLHAFGFDDERRHTNER